MEVEQPPEQALLSSALDERGWVARDSEGSVQHAGNWPGIAAGGRA